MTTVPGTSELCVRERGHSRTFAFDRVYDPSYPLPAALNDIDALVRACERVRVCVCDCILLLGWV